MFEIVALILSISAIAGFARTRGGSSLLWGGVALGGYLLLLFGVAFALAFAKRGTDSILPSLAAWAWIGLVALWTRFGIGAGRAKPDGMWVCHNCKFLNQHYAVICEACQQPFEKQAKV